ncbi:hypothetical protein SISNIDRAFT_456828 [Sistotremastrum niveocremeum HHB9708]|uniref:Uncharacterized protein n=2 Tax=Sistotremastraceae TaxID=3402574 RepID=A0A164S7Y2_9AGAM|nr:hypothetical protein SISNIDRAFT_456828 [Sistotremastrum niveocremeum HHB9708]KZT36711.1 hypothetical protein SISSUDRAFT_1049552 [Sistotremastrum suecicum HHB10207 ss-3]
MDHPQPPQFFIKAGQLYEMYNETSILYGNIYNTTDSSFAPLPFKLTFGPTKMGVQDGHWAWKGTQLFYHHGNSNNFGLFFSCSEPSGTRGVYLDLKVRRTPNECDMTTLHSLGKARYA